MKSRPQKHTLYKSHALGQQMIIEMITKIVDQINDPITNNQHNDHFSITQHVTLPNWEYIADNFNYITSEFVRLREGC